MKKLLLVLILFSLFFIQACGFEIVDTGHRGVKTRFGEVVSGPLPEGWHWYNPFTSSITELDVRVKRWDGKTQAYTKDVQQADVQFTLNYHLDPSQTHVIYRTVGVGWEQKLVPQVVIGTLKAVVGQWDAVDLIGNRAKAQKMAQEQIKKNLAAKGVIVTRFELRDLQYTEKFEQSVENKQVAIQKAIEEKNRTKQIQEQARQKVIAAKASATAIRIRATALQANPLLIKYEAVKKWDGKLPNFMTGSGTVPFIDITKQKK